MKFDKIQKQGLEALTVAFPNKNIKAEVSYCEAGVRLKLIVVDLDERLDLSEMVRTGISYTYPIDKISTGVVSKSINEMILAMKRTIDFRLENTY
jgi:hypothetical protein